MDVPTLGSFVQVDLGYRGRVYKVHDSFQAVGESRQWLNGLVRTPSAADISGPWFSLLTEPNGAATVPLSWLTIVEPFPSANPGSAKYFNDDAGS